MPKRLDKKKVHSVDLNKRIEKNPKEFININSSPKIVHSNMEVVHEIDNVARIIKTEPADKMDLPENVHPCEFIQLKEPVFKEEYIEIKVSPDEVHSDIEVVNEIDNIAKVIKDEPVSSDEVDSENNSDSDISMLSIDESSSDVTTPIGQKSGSDKHGKIGTKQNQQKNQSIDKNGTTTQTRPSSSGGRKEKDNPIRLIERHFPHPIPGTGPGRSLRRECYVCKHTEFRPRKRRSTRFICVDCNVSLCVYPCFEDYHSKPYF